ARRDRLADVEVVGGLAGVGARVGIARDVAAVAEADTAELAGVLLTVGRASEGRLLVGDAPPVDTDEGVPGRPAPAAGGDAMLLDADGSVRARARVAARGRITGADALRKVAREAGGAGGTGVAGRRASSVDALRVRRALRGVDALVFRGDARSAEALR